MKVIAKNQHGQSRAINLIEPPLGRGGEGSVYKVEGIDNAVAKIYHNKSDQFREQKIKAMLEADIKSSAFTWPKAALYTPNQEFAGYIMPILDSKKFQSWFTLANKSERMKVCPQFNFLYAITACYNLLVALEEIHSKNIFVGDLNESGVFVSQNAQVCLIDNDSFACGSTLKCLVGKPEYTAPSLQGKHFKDVERTQSTDLFAAMVLMYQMLTGGIHPCDGTYIGDENPTIAKRIQNRQFPGLEKTTGYTPNIKTRVIKCLPVQLVKMFLALAKESNGINTSKCINMIEQVRSGLKQCNKEGRHFYLPSEHTSCPWCKLQFDPWGKQQLAKRQQRKQESLPQLGFSNNSTGPNIKRVSTKTTTPPVTVTSASPSVVSITPPPPAANPITPPPAPPIKKGRKTLLTYPDGSTRPRPPLRILFRGNPKLAWSCLIEETPHILRFTWGDDRPPMNILSIPIAAICWFVSCIFINVAFYYKFVPYITNPIPDSYRPTAVSILNDVVSPVGSGVSLTVFLFVIGAGLWHTIREMRIARRRLYPDEHENSFKTWIHSLLIPVIYGPFTVLLIMVCLLLYLLFALISNLFDSRKF